MEDYIVDRETLKQQTGVSLVNRCELINQKYPFPKMNTALLRRIYRKHGVKNKAIQYKKFIQPELEEQLPALIEEVRRQLEEAEKEEYLTLYLDETIFSRKAMLRTAWARRHENAHVDEAMLNEPTMALLMSISKENGVEPWKIFPKSVNSAKFCKYLDMVRERHPDRKICIFMDNLRVHTSKKVRANSSSSRSRASTM